VRCNIKARQRYYAEASETGLNITFGRIDNEACWESCIRAAESQLYPAGMVRLPISYRDVPHEIANGLWRAIVFEIGGSSAVDEIKLGYCATYEAGIFQFPDSQDQVQPFRDKVKEFVRNPQIQKQFRVILDQTGQRRDNNFMGYSTGQTEANPPGRRLATLEHRLEAAGFLDKCSGTLGQPNAFIGCSNHARGAVKEACADPILKACDHRR